MTFKWFRVALHVSHSAFPTLSKFHSNVPPPNINSKFYFIAALPMLMSEFRSNAAKPLLIFFPLLTTKSTSQHFTFYPTYCYQKDEWALPWKLQCQKSSRFSPLRCTVSHYSPPLSLPLPLLHMVTDEAVSKYV
jgi:hypothetical protein